MREELKLAELLGALSLTTDLGAGVPFEKGLRTCVVASALAAEYELGAADRRTVYHPSLLRSLGCTAHGSTFAAWFDDDVAIQRELKILDFDDPDYAARQAARFAPWAGERRAAVLADRFAKTVLAYGAELATGSCEVSARLGEELGLPGGVVDALDEVYERYDARGLPAGRGGEQLTIAARVVHVAERAVMADYDGGGETVVGEVLRHAGGQLDPDLRRTFAAHTEAILAALDTDDIFAVALAREPAPRRAVSAEEIDRACVAFATFADLKGRLLLGHSLHVAGFAERGAQLLGFDADACSAVRIGGLLLDIGRVGVSSATWDRPGPLGQVEWERVRLHSYWTERILGRCRMLDRLAPSAGAHHERLDGSGYHRGSKGAELSATARLLAAADMFAALTEPRPHRPATSGADAAATLREEVRAGRLDGEAATAVIDAAGLPRQRIAWPNELTDREVEVLRVLVQGLSNRQIADQLVLSPRTVQHHLASIYDKINLRTRAGAAVFAIAQGAAITPVLNASSTSRPRLGFCDSSSTSKRSNSARRLALTASMLTTNSSAICQFEVGTACGAANGPASAISTRRCAGVSPSSAARRSVLVSRVVTTFAVCAPGRAARVDQPARAGRPQADKGNS